MQAWVVAKGRVPLIRENSINTCINYKVWFHPTSILRPVKTLSCLKLIWTGIQGIYMVNPFCSKITQDNQAGIPKSSDSELWEQLPISAIRGSFLFQRICLGLIQILVPFSPTKWVGQAKGAEWILEESPSGKYFWLDSLESVWEELELIAKGSRRIYFTSEGPCILSATSKA